MKVRMCLVAAAMCLVASLGAAMEIGGRMVATLDVVNEDRIPHSVTIDMNNHVIQVFAQGGGATPLPPGQDVAMRVGHGPWRVIGDSGREINIRFHHGQDYKLHLSPYRHGDVRTIVGVIDDGYSHFNVPLLDMRRHRHFDDYDNHDYNANFHGDHYGQDGYQYYRTDSKESLGHALHEAFDGFLHNLGDQMNNSY